MPIYEYFCSECSNEFEKIVPVGGPAPACPACGGGVERKISLSAFHLKGGGWYSDAYAGRDNTKPSTPSSASSDSAGESSSTKSGGGATSSAGSESASSGSSDSGSSSSKASSSD